MRSPALKLDRPGWATAALALQGQRGAALFVVLLFCAFLAGLTGVAVQSATSGARGASVFLDEMRADELGRGAADAVAAWITAGSAAAQRGGAFATRLEDSEIDVDYRSESARVDVNTAPIDLIAALLAQAGAEPGVLATARERIAALRGPVVAFSSGPTAAGAGPAGGDAAASLTQTVARLGAPPATPAVLLQQPLEAVSAWRLPGAVAERVLPALTVANGTRSVDPVLADRLVLAALLGGDEARVDDYIQRRDQGFVDTGSALALLPVEAQPYAGFADVSAVRALVRVTVAHRFKRRYEIVLDPPAFAGEPPKILSWRPLF